VCSAIWYEGIGYVIAVLSLKVQFLYLVFSRL
jgi:hypothetical protein